MRVEIVRLGRIQNEDKLIRIRGLWVFFERVTKFYEIN